MCPQFVEGYMEEGAIIETIVAYAITSNNC
jgi:hypothetical protein